MPYVFEKWSINVRKLFFIKTCRPTFPNRTNTQTKSTHGYRCAGSREVTSLRCLVHERLTSLFLNDNGIELQKDQCLFVQKFHIIRLTQTYFTAFLYVLSDRPSYLLFSAFLKLTLKSNSLPKMVLCHIP